jgi:two-component system, NarL family, response regulator LiaR
MSDGGLTVVGQAADLSQAVGLATRCAPDVVLLDAALPPDGGLVAMQAVMAAAPDARVVVLAAADSDEAALLAVADGAVGYLPRDIDLGALARAVGGVLAGEGAISRAMAARLMERLKALSAERVGMRPVRSELTTREWEVLDLMKSGASTAQIARELVVSPDTVYSHIQHILRKLGAHSRAEAVAIALRPGPG